MQLTLALVRAVVAHDARATRALADAPLCAQIDAWQREEGDGATVVPLLTKQLVLSEPQAHALLWAAATGAVGEELLVKKPALAELLHTLRDAYPPRLVERAMARASTMADRQIRHQLRDVPDLVKQLGNRDDRKRGKGR